jgi:hypothetical protein
VEVFPVCLHHLPCRPIAVGHRFELHE